MYMMIGTCLDLALVVERLVQFCKSPTLVHWNAVNQVLRYMKGTKNLRHCFSGRDEIDLHGYSESWWAENGRDQNSTSSYTFMMSGSPTSWFSRKQSVVAISTCETEYISLSAACKPSVWLKRFLLGLVPELKLGFVLYIDSHSVIKLSGKNEGVHRRNKHIDIAYHYVRDAVVRKEVTLDHKPRNDMIADILTNHLDDLRSLKPSTLQDFEQKTNVYNNWSRGNVDENWSIFPSFDKCFVFV